MTNEQEEAIKYLEFLNRVESIDFYRIGLIEIKKCIETVLNMLKEKDKEIENLKREILKKDKIIDLMAQRINEAYSEENNFYFWFEKIFGIVPDGNYSEEIKQYFENKVDSIGQY